MNGKSIKNDAEASESSRCIRVHGDVHCPDIEQVYESDSVKESPAPMHFVLARQASTRMHEGDLLTVKQVKKRSSPNWCSDTGTGHLLVYMGDKEVAAHFFDRLETHQDLINSPDGIQMQDITDLPDSTSKLDNAARPTDFDQLNVAFAKTFTHAIEEVGRGTPLPSLDMFQLLIDGVAPSKKYAVEDATIYDQRPKILPKPYIEAVRKVPSENTLKARARQKKRKARLAQKKASNR